MLKTIIVVDNPTDWAWKELEVKVVTSDEYLKKVQYEKVKVLNLCRSFSYQSKGYYVSLVASARGHKPQPSLHCIADFNSHSILKKLISPEFENLIQSSLNHLSSKTFVLSLYFGKNLAKHYDKLSSYIFKQFSSPFLQAKFIRTKDKWVLFSLTPISPHQITEIHKGFAFEQTKRYFSQKNTYAGIQRKNSIFDLAILVDPLEKHPPSDKRALKKFETAAKSLGFSVEFIQKSDFGRVAEFDALFIRTTTSVNHYTYHFSRRAYANGLEVIDSPLSILHCCNKIYLHEILTKYRFPTPKTWLCDLNMIKEIAQIITYPAVLKEPDGSFSQGVFKVENAEEFKLISKKMLNKSELILIQQFMPSAYDWRIGILDGKTVFACKYFMAKDHWQIYKKKKSGNLQAGNFESLPIQNVPKKALQLAIKGANLIGKGLYGVDLKEVEGNFYIIEINDNPNIDSGVEDLILGDELYLLVMRTLYERLLKKRKHLTYVS
jgi:glutathione synthase/RimK-type ligase-like ATP-grasp enzyme